MKICKCVSCKRPFEMPDNYFGIIYCEDCEEKAAQNVCDSTRSVYPLLSDVLAELKAKSENDGTGLIFIKLEDAEDIVRKYSAMMIDNLKISV